MSVKQVAEAWIPFTVVGYVRARRVVQHDTEIRGIDQVDELRILPATVKSEALKLAKQVVSTLMRG